MPSTLLFINCMILKERVLPPDSHTNTVNLRPTGQSTQNATRGAIFLCIVDSAWVQTKGLPNKPPIKQANDVHVNPTRIVRYSAQLQTEKQTYRQIG